MARDFAPGLGPTKLDRILTHTVIPPTDVSPTNPVKQWEPLKNGREGTTKIGLGETSIRTVDDDIPELIAIHKITLANDNLGVIPVPRPIAGDLGTRQIVLELPFDGNVPNSGDIQFLANGYQSYKLVLASAGTGIGSVLKADVATHRMLVYI